MSETVTSLSGPAGGAEDGARSARRSLSRICRVVWDYPVGGRATYGLQPNFYYLSREQAKRGYEVHVIARKVGSQPALEVFDGVTIHRAGSPFSLNMVRLMQELAKGRRDSVIHTHATAGLPMAVLRRYFGAPLVSHVHGTSQGGYVSMKLVAGRLKRTSSPWTVTTSYIRERSLWRSADRVAAVSDSVADDLQSRYGVSKERIRVVYNGIDPALFKPIPGARIPGIPELDGKKVVLYVGHFGLRKGVPHLISSMDRVVKEVPESVLVCVGGVPEWLGKGEYWAYLQSLIRTKGLEGKVFLRDRISNRELPQFYSASDVFVLPSYYEAFGKVILEAMACERPVVVTREGGPREVIMNRDSPAGLLVDFGSEEQLAEAIVTILKDEKRGRAMGANGRRRVLADFTWQRVAERLDGVYQEALEGR